MFRDLVLRSDDLQWFVPMLVGALVLTIATIAMFVVKSWTVVIVATLATALIGASVFAKVSVTKDGIIIETAKLSVAALENLEKASRANADALSSLSGRVDQLAATALKISAAQSTGGSTAAAELKEISKEATVIQNATKQTDRLLQDVEKKTELIRAQINQLSRKLPF